VEPQKSGLTVIDDGSFLFQSQLIPNMYTFEIIVSISIIDKGESAAPPHQISIKDAEKVLRC
jgi:hypothetical protein